MRKLFKVLILLTMVLSILTVTKINEASAHTINSCSSLTKLVGKDAISFETGTSVSWKNVHPNLIAAKDQYVSAIKAKGWTITFNSAYRPQEYQNHLREVLTKANAGDACAKKEKVYHALGTQVAVTSNHTKGLAFDATVKNSKGVVLNTMTHVNSDLKALAKSVGLQFTLPTSDGVHHELITKPSTATNTPLYSFNAAGKIIRKTTVQKVASTSGGNFGNYSSGNKVTIVGVQGKYYKVKYKTTYAFVAISDVTVTVTEKAKTGKATITSSNGFNVRQYPYETATKLTTVGNKEKVTLLAVSGEWYKVKVGKVTGYIKGVKTGLTIDAVIPTYTFNATVVPKKAVAAYKEANNKSGSLGTIAKGTKLTAVGVQGNYYKVNYKSTYAYVAVSSVAITPKETAKTGTATITQSSGFKLLRYPYETSSALGSIAKGAKVTLVALAGEWYKVKTGSITGYIKAVKSGLSINSVKSEYPKTGYVNTAQGTKLNVRSTASTSAKIVAKLSKNTAVTITGKKSSWYSVKVGTITGWVSASYITFTKPVVSQYPKTGYVNIVSSVLNVRATASTSAKILATLKKGTAVTITGKSGNWYSVKVNKITGWVSADYIIFDKTILLSNTKSYSTTNINVALPKSKGKKATKETFQKYLPILGLLEGGYSNKPQNLGGETNLGITASLYKAYYPKKNIKNITHNEASNIFYKEFWVKQVGNSKMSERLAIVLFDTAVNMGNDDATKALQRVMGFKGKNIDGLNGPATKSKLATYTISQQDTLALKILQIRKDYRPAKNEYLEGWENRDKRLYEELKNY